MKAFVCAVLFAFATAQISWIDRLRDRFNNLDDTVDTIHGWRLEDHKLQNEHLLLFINDQTPRTCIVIHVSSSWEHLLDNEDNLHHITEEIYAIVVHHDHLTNTPMRPGDLATDFHDFDAAHECSGHSTYALSYTPSFA